MINDMDTQDLRYPIGRFTPIEQFDARDAERWLERIAALPARMRDAVAGLDEAQLDTPYRSGGWTVRQVVHHVPDSHMNGYIRTCLALTENEPVIRPYDEAEWARLPFMQHGDVADSLDLLDTVHRRWLHVLRGITDAQWARRLVHPDDGGRTIAAHVQLYAWHGEHHVAHVTSLRERNGWR